MFRRQEPDVLVVGAGPVGLFAALCLDQRDLKPMIIDEALRTAAHSYALALHPESLRLLHDLGIDPESEDGSLRIDRVAFYDGPERRVEIRLSDLPGGYPYLLVVRQSQLERLLEEALGRNKTKVKWLHRLSGWQPEHGRLRTEIHKLDRISTGYAAATSEWDIVKTTHEKPQFLLAADGHRSFVRRRLAIDYDRVGETEVFAVFEFAHPDPVENEIRVVLNDRSTNVLWPLPGGRCRWSFQVWGELEEIEDLHYKSRLAVQVGQDWFPHLTDERLSELVRERAPWFDYQPGEVFWSVLARFERRLARNFGRERVWIAGDAGHLTGPVGVHSMNVGLREAKELAERIDNVFRGQASLETFRAYEQARRNEWRQLLGLEGGLVASSEADPWVAHHASRILSCLPASGRDLELLAQQLGLRWSASPAQTSA